MSDVWCILLSDDVINMVLLIQVMTVLYSFGIMCNSAPVTSKSKWPSLDHPHSSHDQSPSDRDTSGTRARFEHLCETVSRTVNLNSRHYELFPPFYVEKRCKHLTRHRHGLSKIQKCGFDLLHCVQSYEMRHFSRRKTGTSCWEPYTLEIASGCDCMWPTEDLGPLRGRDEL